MEEQEGHQEDGSQCLLVLTVGTVLPFSLQ